MIFFEHVFNIWISDAEEKLRLKFRKHLKGFIAAKETCLHYQYNNSLSNSVRVCVKDAVHSVTVYPCFLAFIAERINVEEPCAKSPQVSGKSL